MSETDEDVGARNWLWSAGTFVVIAGFGFAARLGIGRVYSAGEAVFLLESLARSGLYLGAAAATASVTVLALMLTLVGMIRRVDVDFGTQAYRNVERIAKLATASLMSSLLLLLILVFPIGEFDGIANNWYPLLYNIIFAAVVVVTALLAATITMVYRTLRRVLQRITPGDDV